MATTLSSPTAHAAPTVPAPGSKPFRLAFRQSSDSQDPRRRTSSTSRSTVTQQTFVQSSSASSRTTAVSFGSNADREGPAENGTSSPTSQASTTKLGKAERSESKSVKQSRSPVLAPLNVSPSRSSLASAADDSLPTPSPLTARSCSSPSSSSSLRSPLSATSSKPKTSSHSRQASTALLSPLSASTLPSSPSLTGGLASALALKSKKSWTRLTRPRRGSTSASTALEPPMPVRQHERDASFSSGRGDSRTAPNSPPPSFSSPLTPTLSHARSTTLSLAPSDGRTPAAKKDLKRKPSRMFMSLRKSSLPMLPGGGSSTDRRPSAADVFRLESGSRSAPPHGARAEDEDGGDVGIGRPFQFQHQMHVGLEDLSALPPEWITQLKSQGLSTEDLLKLAKAKSQSMKERSEVQNTPIVSSSPSTTGLAEKEDVSITKPLAPAVSSSDPPPPPSSTDHSNASSSLGHELPPDGKSYLQVKKGVPPLLSVSLPALSSQDGQDETEDWARGLLGAFGTSSPAASPTFKLNPRFSLPPERRTTPTPPPGSNSSHAHSQSLSFLSAVKRDQAPTSANSQLSFGSCTLGHPPRVRGRSAGPLTSTEGPLSVEVDARGPSNLSEVDLATESSHNSWTSAANMPDHRTPLPSKGPSRASTSCSQDADESADTSSLMEGLEEFGGGGLNARLTSTFGLAPRNQWHDHRRSRDGDDDDHSGGGSPFPDLPSYASGLESLHYPHLRHDPRLSVASRGTATSRVTSLSPSTFSSSDLHSQENAVISRAFVMSSQPLGEETNVSGKSMRLTIFAPNFTVSPSDPSHDGRPDEEAEPPLSASLSSVSYSSSREEEEGHLMAGRDALDQAVQMFRERSIDNLQGLAEGESRA